MRILHVNKFLYRRGGAEAYMLDVASLQEAAGHEVAFFAMAHPQNLPSRYQRLFPSRVDFEPPPPGVAGKLRGAGRLLWSSSAAAGMRALLNDFRPDVVHLHNIYHQLSPSILQPLRRGGIGVVMTLHDYKLACPTYRFLDHGRICEACLPRRFWQPIAKRCNSGSLGASTLNAVEMTVHTFAGAYAPVDVFACPSRFMMRKMQQGRVFPERLRHLPLFVDAGSTRAKDSPGRGLVFAGRLSREKGVDTLIEAVAGLPQASLDVAGDGPARGELEELSSVRGASGRIRFHGHLPAEKLREILGTVSLAVLPSRWHENMPLAVLEAFAAGLPVVGTGLGGIPELIEPGVDGQIVPPDDPAALRSALADLLSDPERSYRMGQAGRRKVLSDYSPSGHLAGLFSLYDEALGRRSG